MNTPLHPTTLIQLEAYCKNPALTLLITGPPADTNAALAFVVNQLFDAPSKQVIHRIRLQDDQKELSIEQVRDFKQSMTTKTVSNSSIARLGIIEDAEKLSHAAQNSLLKLLEEPPEQTSIVLTNQQGQRLLATISSRVQTIHCKPQSIEQIESTLNQQNISYKKNELTALHAYYEGFAATIIEHLEQKRDASVFAQAKNFLTSSTFDRINQQTSFAQTSALEALLHDLSIMAMHSMHSSAKNHSQWHKMLKKLQTYNDLLKKNVQPKILYLRMCFEL